MSGYKIVVKGRAEMFYELQKLLYSKGYSWKGGENTIPKFCGLDSRYLCYGLFLNPGKILTKATDPGYFDQHSYQEIQIHDFGITSGVTAEERVTIQDLVDAGPGG